MARSLQARCILIVALLGISIAFTSLAAAESLQSWPSKRIRGIIPIGPGSAVDIIARSLFERLSQALGQPIVPENKTGAGGTLGAVALTTAPPDGYTIMVQSGTLTLAPYLYENLPYDTEKDIIPVAALATQPNVLVVSPSKHINTIAEFIAAAKAKSGTITYSSPGVGTSTHITMERFAASADFQATHIPFRGAVEALTEVIAGRVDAYFAPVLLALPQIRSGALVPLVVISGQRSAALPDIPTIAEVGYPDANKDVWIALFVAAGTPNSVIDKLRVESAAVIASPSYRERLANLGAEAPTMSPAQFRQKFADDLVSNGEILRKLGIAQQVTK